MRFVIYDDETLEPITVLNLRGFTERDIEKRGRRYRVPVPLGLPPIARYNDDIAGLAQSRMRIVDLEFEPFRRRRRDGLEQESWFCFTKATELAMLLNPDWLPGQRSAINYLTEQNDKLVDMLIATLTA